MDKNVFKDFMVGIFEFDLTRIYNSEAHAIQHQTIAFTNPDAK